MQRTYSWILDSGGAGRGAWQGGVIYEFMRWCRENGSYPSITMGASAGGYAAADVATGTEQTVMKGWTYWGAQNQSLRASDEKSRFRAQLHDSVFYVMDEKELSGVFQENKKNKLVVFTTRVRRSDGKTFKSIDRMRFFLKSATRKLPRLLKYFPGGYAEDPILFALNLPAGLCSEYVRPLTRENYHAVIEASCLVPFAMGSPILPEELNVEPHAGDRQAVFIDGGYTLKMPMRLFEEDSRFPDLAKWVSADKTVVFCCDPKGFLWESSSRLHCLNSLPSVKRALQEKRLLIISPDHKVEAGFLCLDNNVIMRTFRRGQEQARRLLYSDLIRRFYEI
jgi:predicted acylesterase/phospholipase RssA